MNKQEFLQALEKRLGDLGAEERAQALEFCAEGIDDRMEDGRSEEEAVAALGSVEDVARDLLADRPLKDVVRERVRREGDAGRIVLLILAGRLLGGRYGIRFCNRPVGIYRAVVADADDLCGAVVVAHRGRGLRTGRRGGDILCRNRAGAVRVRLRTDLFRPGAYVV